MSQLCVRFIAFEEAVPRSSLSSILLCFTVQRKKTNASDKGDMVNYSVAP